MGKIETSPGQRRSAIDSWTFNLGLDGTTPLASPCGSFMALCIQKIAGWWLSRPSEKYGQLG